MILAALIIGAQSPANAITFGQVDDFQSGDAAGWDAAVGNTISTNVPDAGPLGAGDNALDVSIGARFTVFNRTQWTGNFIAAGVTRISLDVQHSNDYLLALRLGVANGGFSFGGVGDTYVSSDAVDVPNDGLWHRVQFDVSPSAFVPSIENNNAIPDPFVALTNVTHFRLIHNPSPADFTGSVISGSFRLDNIRAVPEPSFLAMAAVAVGAVAAIRRRCARRAA